MKSHARKHSRPALLPHFSKRAYDIISGIYDTTTGLTGWRRQLAEHALAGLVPGRLLDVGCGTGFVLSLAKKRGFDVTGIDPSEGMLAKAKDKYGFMPGEIIAAPAEALPFQNKSFDIVLACGMLVHVPDPRLAIAEMVRVAQIGGIIRIIDHDRPREKNLLAPFTALFLQMSGDILHDYEYYFRDSCKLKSRLTLGRGGYLQRFDFVRRQ